MKKILSAIIILTMIISTFSMVVFATETAENTGDLMGVTLTAKADLAANWSKSGISSAVGGFSEVDLDENNKLVANLKIRHNAASAITFNLAFLETATGSWIYQHTTKSVEPNTFVDFQIALSDAFVKTGDTYVMSYTNSSDKTFSIDIKNVMVRFQTATSIPSGTKIDIVCTDDNGYEKLALMKGQGGAKYTVEDYRAIGKKTYTETEVGGASLLATNRPHRSYNPTQIITDAIVENGLGTYIFNAYARTLETPDKPITVGLGMESTYVIDGASKTTWNATAKTTIADNQWHKLGGTITLAESKFGSAINITKVKIYEEMLYEGMTGDAGAFKGDVEWDAFSLFKVYPDGTYSENLFKNPDLNIDSDGNTPSWETYGTFTMTNSLAIPVQEGGALHAEDRNSNSSGPSQTLTGRIEKGTYYYSGYVRLTEVPAQAIKISLAVELTLNGGNGAWPSVSNGSTSLSDTEWHKVTGTITISKDFDRAVTFINVTNAEGGAQNLSDVEIDGIFLAKQDENGLYGENIILNPTMECDENGITDEWGVYRVATITNTAYTPVEPNPDAPDGVENADGSVSYGSGRVPATDKNINYSGRFYDVEGAKQAAFESYVEIKFTGTSIAAASGSSKNIYYELDGVLNKTIQALGGLNIKGLSEGEHTLKIFASAQTSRFILAGFQLDKGAKTLPINQPKKIEFIGDSITEGYVASADKDGDISNNSYLNSYALKTGRLLNEKYGWGFNTVAFGGIGMVLTGSPDPLTMGERYFTQREYVSSTDGTTAESAKTAAGTYDYNYVPDYIVINLGTNDSKKDNAVFVNNYVKFIEDLQKINPNVVIFCMTPYNGSKATQVKAAVSQFDKNVYVIDSATWGVQGGADSLHPAPSGHNLATEKLFEVLDTYITDGTLPEVEPYVNGMQFNVTEDIYHAYPYFRATAANATGLTADMADEDGYIERSYTVYNVGEYDVEVAIFWQTGWDNLKDTVKDIQFIKKGRKAEFTIKVKVDENGMATRNKDSEKVALSTLTFRVEINNSTASENTIYAGTSFVVVPNDLTDFSVMNINSKGIQKGENGTGAATYNNITKIPTAEEDPEIPTEPDGTENEDGTISYGQGYVPVTDKNINWSGRFYTVNETSKQAAFESYVEIKFTGTSISTLDGSSGNVYYELDGVLKNSSTPIGGINFTNLADGEHTLRLYATAQTSRFILAGFKIDAGAKTLPIEQPKKIEFIGDSITEGYVDSADATGGIPANSYLNSYALKTGRLLNQKYDWGFNTVAFGGIGIVKAGGNGDPLTMGERYFTQREYVSSLDGITRESALAAAGVYDYNYVPDYIVINMGTNDSAQDSATFAKNYVKLIEDLQEMNPDIVIFCMTPFNGAKAMQIKAAVAKFDKNVYLIDSATWGIKGGADNLHPAPASQETASEMLFEILDAYITDGTLPEVEPYVNGMQFNVTEDIYHAYPYFRAGATNATGLTADMADENGYIERTYTIYNVGDYDVNVRVWWQTGWYDVIDKTAKVNTVVKKGQKAELTLKLQIDENGMATHKDGTKVALSTLSFRTEIEHSNKSETIIPAGTSYIVVPNDPTDFAVLNISSKALDKGTDGRGAVSYNTITELPSEKIMGATLDIGSSLTVNYYAQLWDNLDATLKVTRNGATVELEGVYDSVTGYYIYQYKGVNPQCMTDNISAELIAGGEVISSKAEYSVKQYADNLAKKTAEELKITEDKYNKLITLLSDMLVYGKNSQDYMKYNLDNYATDGITWLKASEFVTPANIVKNIVKNDENNKITGAGVRVENVNKIYFTVNLTDANAEVYVDGEKAEVIDNKVYTKDIKATGFGAIHTAEVKVNGETVSKIEYNVNAYINSKNTNSSVGTLVKALNNYGASAVEYGK